MNQTPVILPKRKELGFLNPKGLNNPNIMNRNKFCVKEQNKQKENVQTIKVKSLKIKLEFDDDNSISKPEISKNNKSEVSNKTNAIQPNDSVIINLKKMIAQRQAYNNLNGYNVKNLKQKHYVVNVKDPYEPTRAEIHHDDLNCLKNHKVEDESKMHSKMNKLIDGCYVCKYATKREIVRLPEIISRNKLRSQNTKTDTTTQKATEDQTNKGSSMWSINIEESQLDYHKPTMDHYSGSRNNSLMTTMNFLGQYESRLSYFRRQQNNLVRSQLKT